MSFNPPQPPFPQGQQYGYQPGPPMVSMQKRSGWTPASIVAIVGASLLVVGSLLDWIVVKSGFGEISFGGMDTDDGKVTLAVGIIGLVLFLVGAGTSTAALHVIGAVVSVVGGVTAVIDIADVQDKADDLGSEFATASVGIGLYVCVIGAVMGLAAGIVAAAINPD